MTSILSSGSVDVSIRARELSSMVPYEILSRIRARDSMVSQADVNEALNNIGIDHIYEIMSYQKFTIEIAEALGVPALYLERWIRNHPDHKENEEIVNELSAQLHLRDANNTIHDIKDGDIDVARTAKIKADHFVKMAEKVAPHKYDKVSKSTGLIGATFHLGINPGFDFTKSRVIDSQ